MKLTAKSALGLFHVWVGSSGAKLVRVMKLTTIIILVVCLHSSANGIAQNTVTFSGKDVNLESVFTAIKKQTSYRFFFNTSIIQNASKITIEVKNAPIEQVLNLALKDQSLTFAIKGRTIFVMKKPEEDNKSSQVMPLQGDPVTVKGRVLDENGAPAQGVNITVKGTNKGTTTNLKGEFELRDVNEEAVLLISSVGYDRQEVFVKDKKFVTAQLKLAVGNLDELQVIAYGATSKRFNTGNVTTIKASEIEKQPVNNPLLALEGRVPGLFITQNTGVSGGGITVRIQGQNSIANGNDPFYVIDGIPFVSQLPATEVGNPLGNSGGMLNGKSFGVGNPLAFINPSDIESIEVLKDADATAIYGSRAANGAILITTKKGKVGKIKLDVGLQAGWGKITKKLEMLNTEQYIEMRREAKRNNNNQAVLSTDYDINGFWDTTRFTDWQEKLIGNTSKFSLVNVSVSGGNSAVKYLIGGTYRKQTSVFPGEFYDESSSMHFNINSTSLDQRFNIQLSGNYLNDNNILPSSDITRSAILLEPNAPELYNTDGSLNWMPNSSGTSTWSNPLADILYRTYKNKTNNLLSSLILGYKFYKDLEIKSSFSYNNIQTTEFQLDNPIIAIKPENRINTLRSAAYGNRIINTLIIEPQINYNKSFQVSKLEVLIGATIQQNNSNGQRINGTGYTSDLVMEDMRSAASINVQNSFVTKYKYNALFARVNYNLLNKYIINLNGRRDGSSRFGPKNQFHNFGSVGSAWIFSQENFFKGLLPIISFGKLKASYGTTGNDQILDYAFMNLYIPVTGSPYQGIPGTTPNGLFNPYLEWEETKKISVGIDIGILKDKIFFEGNYAQNRSSNQLISYILPSVTGYDVVTKNFPATVQNESFEFSLRTTPLKIGKIFWSSNVNITIPKNKLLSFPDLETSSYSSSLIIGKPLNVIKLYHYLGVDPATGLYTVADINGNSTSSPNSLVDKTVLYSTIPKFYGGVVNTISYKNIQLDFFFQFVNQLGANTIYQGTANPGRYVNGFSNQPATVLNRWQKPGDNASIAKYSTAVLSVLPLNSDAGYTDASYIRLKNISLSYEFPNFLKRKVKYQYCKLYLQGQNLLTITNYQGMDPESQGKPNSSISLPPLKIFTIGFQVGL